MKNKSGIYTITSPSGKMYVGQAQCIERRRYVHLRELRIGKHKNKPLQDAFKKYGESALKFSVLEFCALDKLDEREQHWIDAFDFAMLYNIARCASAPARGIAKSPETRAKMSAAGKAKTKSPEHVAKMTQSRLSNPNWAATCARIGDAMRGKPNGRKGISNGPCRLTPDERQKLGELVSLKKGTSGYRGVSFNSHYQRWKAVARVGPCRKFLGYFDSKELAWSAICSYKAAHEQSLFE